MGNDDALIKGRVKWFDIPRGFGFVVNDDGGGDILLHANVLRNYGQSSVAEGARISLTMQETDRGYQATEILSLEPPEAVDSVPLPDLEQICPEDLARLPLEPARVKWFDRAKGFGFANIFGRAEDVFIHIEVLRRSGLSELMPGEAIALRVIEGNRGRMASFVQSWDSAVCLGRGKI